MGFVSHERIKGLLREAGFQAVREYGGYYFSDYEKGGELFIIEASKKIDRREAH